MQKIFLKRTLRDFRANLLRYIALFFLIVLCMFIVTGFIGSAQSVIETVNRHAEQNSLEDGQFGVFLPLSEADIAAIEAGGVTLEPCFYLDFALEDGSTLRLMKNREAINRLDLCSGRLAAQPDEIVLERIYAAAHGLAPGDTLLLAGQSFTVSGIATSPDYDHCVSSVADMAADGSVFGTAFVTAEAYSALLAGGQALHSEEYRYSYRLGGTVTDAELKEQLLSLRVSPDDIQDFFFQEAAGREMAARNEAADGVQALADGSGALADALAQMEEGTASLRDGLQTAYTALETLDGGASPLTAASAQVLEALNTLDRQAGQLTFSLDGLYQLQAGSAALTSAAAELDAGLQALAEQTAPSAFEAAVDDALAQYGRSRKTLSPDAKRLYSMVGAYLGELHSYLAQAAEGASALQGGLTELDAAIAGLPASLGALNDGICQFQAALTSLSGAYGGLDGGLHTYTEGLHTLYSSFEQIVEGAAGLERGAAALSDSGQSLHSGVLELQSQTTQLLDTYFPYEIQTLTEFLPAADNPRIKASVDDVAINKNIGLLAGVLVLILISYVLSIFVVHSIDQESAIIGALYAMGVKREQLMLHYTMLPVLLCLAGGTVGTALGYSRFGINLFAGDAYAYFSMPQTEAALSPLLLAYGILVPPAAAFLVNTFVIRRRLRRPALALLRREQKQRPAAGLPLHRLPYLRAFQLRQLLREKRSCFAVLAGMFVSMLVLMIGITCGTLCVNVRDSTAADVRYEYLYLYKYPPEAVPEGGYEAYIESLQKEVLGYNMDITVIGLTEENPFFPAITSQRKTEVSISSSVARKYGLSAGDELILNDTANEAMVCFTVKEVVPYSAGLCVFMEIGSMRELWGQDECYFNAVYSAGALEVDAGRLYAVSSRADAIKSAGIFIEMMRQTIFTLILAAALIFVIVLYQMMKVMLDRSAHDIALLKIFGYRDKELQTLYLSGNFALVAVGALLLIPVCKFLTDCIYPYLVANVAGGMDFSWPVWTYFLVYGLILLCYGLLQIAFVQKIRAASPAVLLKERE